MQELLLSLLIGLMGHDRWEVREAAQVVLSALHQSFDLRREVHRACLHADPEIRWRALAVEDDYLSVTGSSGRLPMVTSLDLAQDDIDELIRDGAAEAEWWPPYAYYEYEYPRYPEQERLATAHWVRKVLQRGIIQRQTVQEQLDRALEKEGS